LLTNEEVETEEQAWKIVFAYARRWQVEMSFRSLKSELAIQSLRVYDWEVRLKLLGLLTLAYAFLMDLMRESMRAARDWLMDYACHRMGSHLQQVSVPFTRVRIALSKLWLQCPCCYVRRSSIPISFRSSATRMIRRTREVPACSHCAGMSPCVFGPKCKT